MIKIFLCVLPKEPFDWLVQIQAGGLRLKGRGPRPDKTTDGCPSTDEVQQNTTGAGLSHSLAASNPDRTEETLASSRLLLSMPPL